MCCMILLKYIYANRFEAFEDEKALRVLNYSEQSTSIATISIIIAAFPQRYFFLSSKLKCIMIVKLVRH